MGSHFWTPIATFSGQFNGNMHKIKNLKISFDAKDSLGSQYTSLLNKNAGVI